MKKKDLLLIGAVVLAALLFWLVPRAAGIFGGTEQVGLLITVDGEEYGRYSLKKDQTIDIYGTNVCEVKDGKVRMKEADCPDKLCIHQGAAYRQGESIVCLPNKVVLEIVGDSSEENQLDAIAQ